MYIMAVDVLAVPGAPHISDDPKQGGVRVCGILLMMCIM